MAFEALRGYLQLASGLTEVTRQRATASARALLAAGPGGLGDVGDRLPAQVREQVAALADDLLATGRGNRDLLLGLVRGEVERAVAGLGLVSAAELETLRRELDALSARVARLEVAAVGAGSRTEAAATPAAQPAKRATTKRATTKRAATKRAAAKGATTSAAAKTATKRTTKRAATTGAAAEATSTGAPRATGASDRTGSSQ